MDIFISDLAAALAELGALIDKIIESLCGCKNQEPPMLEYEMVHLNYF